MPTPHVRLPAAALAAAALAATTACTAVITPAATTYPVDADFNFAELGSMKQGESCSTMILGIFGPTGDASVAAAAAAGNLSRVHYVDSRIENYFLWYRYCVVAYGE